ncbi:MAG: metallophosphoesterase [Erysipelotrichaceae bacterium]|nr:metallophosphoesterase [Erysipelotrichaceae bacterium]
MKKILYFILIFLIIIFGILLYSRFFGTIGLKTKETMIYTNLTESYDGLKIIHFSDLHYKKIITEARVKELIQAINKTKPDLVLFTGDLLDKDYQLKNTDINFLIKELSQIKAKYGNYAILGDQDYQEIENIKNIYIQSNFTVLENEYTIIHNENNDQIIIGGISSYLKNKANINEISQSLQNEDNSIYQIIMVHEPDYIPKIVENLPNTSMIVSGHSINGSINIPIIKQLLLPTGAKNYYKPYYKINQTNIYISNGIGVNQINFRLFNTPSINFYRIKKSN